ncbi:MAG: 4-hydroxy-tetrahydrodipicolinate synthase [Alphaproteobacteria bacterium]|nr:4-hydroxy-tetrahydrodipicolinate synthase [Alphaproteobacteria bacterium]
MKDKTDFGAVITAMVTPFQAKDVRSVDMDCAVRLANFLLEHGTDTLLLNGSTGEAAQLTADERCGLIKNVRAGTPGKTRIIVSTGDTNTDRVINKTNKAFELGADAVLVSVPEYIKPPQQAMYNHFDSVAKSANGMPVIIYNIPGRTGSEILPDTVAKLAYENPNIIGIKQSMPDMDKVSELKIKCPDSFQIYSGDDSLTLPMLSLGAKGVISVASHLEGELISRMIKAFKEGRTVIASNYHQVLYPLYKSIFMTTNPMPIKEALYQRRLIGSPTLRTLGEMDAESKQKMANSLNKFRASKSDFLNKGIISKEI